jgi:hypothetical protein
MKKVIATKPGYYDSLRNPGDIFEVTDETPLGSWLKLEAGADDIYPEVQPRERRDPTPVDDPFVGRVDEKVSTKTVRK